MKYYSYLWLSNGPPLLEDTWPMLKILNTGLIEPHADSLNEMLWDFDY